jgi:hypothetical protein
MLWFVLAAIYIQYHDRDDARRHDPKIKSSVIFPFLSIPPSLAVFILLPSSSFLEGKSETFS